MGTRSRIGVIRGEKVESIYCHWDGYPSHNGRILLEHYRDADKVDALMALGDLSVLAPEIGEDEGTDSFDARSSLADDDPRRQWCCAYGRDRGEKGVDYSLIHPDNEWPDSGQEYEYLYRPESGIWTVREVDGEWSLIDARAVTA